MPFVYNCSWSSCENAGQAGVWATEASQDSISRHSWGTNNYRTGGRALSVPQLQMELIGVGDLLRAAALAVPAYQRSFAWQERHVQELLDDLASAMQGDEAEYFLGSIVLTEAEGRRQVVDGQQRLATAAMFIAAVRDYFHANNEPRKANSIEHDFLASLDVRTEELKPRLSLNSMDNEFFCSQVITAPDKRVAVDSERESHCRMRLEFLRNVPRLFSSNQKHSRIFTALRLGSHP